MQAQTFTNISSAEWQSFRASASAKLIDVRSVSEYATGHVPGAINVPMDELESRFEDFIASSTVVVVCQSGARAKVCAQKMAGLGLDVRVLDGGTSAWADQGLPLVASKRTSWSLERQVRLGAGLIVLIGLALANTVSISWTWLSVFAGFGLTFAGLTNICMMGNILSRMPWNQSRTRVSN